MQEFPPPLAWLPGFALSMGGALGTSVLFDARPTVNPLVYVIKFTFGEPISGKRMMLVWNLFQQYAAKNETIPQGKVESDGPKMTAHVVIKRRLGLPRNEHPAA